MGQKSPRALLVGLSAAAAALGATAIVAAASAPTAHADDFSTLLADIQGTEGIAATAFATAATDFSSGNEAAGLTNLFIGLDDSTVGVPDELQVGLVDLSTSSPLFASNSFDFTFPTPASFTAAVTEAQTFWTLGNNLATTIGTLPNNDFSDAALDNALSTFDQWVAPGQIELIGDLQLLLSSLPAEAVTAF
jgi:hypothetical protein